jgi:hypothetical protein
VFLFVIVSAVLAAGLSGVIAYKRFLEGEQEILVLAEKLH